MVKALFDTYAVPEGFQREVLAEDQVPPDRMSLGLSIRIEMPPERLAAVRAGVDALVAMRNELVNQLKLLDGIARDGSVDWPNSSIVRILRDPTKTFSENSWTRLDQAYAWERGAPGTDACPIRLSQLAAGTSEFQAL
ncbi:MAG: hypothetical protein RLZ51_1991 [Pseudomonadota bacterium]|jgi:hypothetical protein